MHWVDMRAFLGKCCSAYSPWRIPARTSEAPHESVGRDTISKTCSIGAPVRAAVVTTAPIPIHLRPDRAPPRLVTRAGGPRQELLTLSFSELGLRPELLRAVHAQGYTDPTPVQREAIPLVLAGRDLMAGAQTGTGKTAAFVLPMLQRLGPPNTDPRSGRRPIRALVLAPTRELALQVEESVRVYGHHWGVRSTAVYGGVGFSPQVAALRRG